MTSLLKLTSTMLVVSAMAMTLVAVSPSARANSLYHDLGEREGIEILMEDLLLYVAEDKRINHHFVDIDILRLHEKLSEQICELAGGPCVYTGDDMVTSHTGMDLTNTDFNALVEALQKAMDDRNISVGAQNRLLALLAPMHGDIVGR
ncbi:group 1 truncated hemoglobin [Aliidiomarina halalkaliphila]|uniref:Group 1 truncated hemoglobin n=1 Tax=Aliidiomarina halalkaliphila TaxID=2593535 RepID=A0A552X4B0_9GAMM|nr:group 1 truncated hemoglobin [Aliidiomarina halalkaliphila]TRW49433.1 group 1 truncated hemoglobin [Aliidiomarina halalkaliphila]